MKITQNQFKLFQAGVHEWIDFFGLKEWQILFLFERMENNRAEIRFDCVSGIAVFVLNTRWETEEEWVTDTIIRKVAFHEVCELLLGRLVHITNQRHGTTEDGVEEETHRIIRTLENTIWKQWDEEEER